MRTYEANTTVCQHELHRIIVALAGPNECPTSSYKVCTHCSAAEGNVLSTWMTYISPYQVLPTNKHVWHDKTEQGYHTPTEQGSASTEQQYISFLAFKVLIWSTRTCCWGLVKYASRLGCEAAVLKIRVGTVPPISVKVESCHHRSSWSDHVSHSQVQRNSPYFARITYEKGLTLNTMNSPRHSYWVGRSQS